ncbi:uncharacterized protein LOC116308323, partial [Actinia tenebrosa]|uniref:Uncharacterized protein LOC116308323 n=1 Tax=Actinia tenebrosa TaxID=6105 RepID=A0A6P8J4K5_ACTTE
MYFHYESGYDAIDLVGQLRQEKKVAKEIGLSYRSNFLSVMENLVCHFHGIREVGSIPAPRARMSSEKAETKNGEEIHRKVYKYPCSICKKEYNNISNHMRHAHKLSKSQIEELKKEKNQKRA